MLFFLTTYTCGGKMQTQNDIQPRKNFKEGIIMKREQIDEKFKWDISSIYKTIEDYEKDFSIVKDNISKFEQYLKIPAIFVTFEGKNTEFRIKNTWPWSNV